MRAAPVDDGHRLVADHPGVVTGRDESETWLARVLEESRERGVLQFGGSSREAARLVVSGLEGALLVSRPYGDAQRFRDAADGLIARLAAHS